MRQKTNIRIARIALSAILLVLPTFFAAKVQAGFGVSPGEVYNHHIKPGQTEVQKFTLSRSNTNHALDVKVEKDLGEINSWVEITPGLEFTMNEGQKTYEVTVTMKIPNDAELKEYGGHIRFTTYPVETENSEASGVSVSEGARVDIDIVTTNEDYTNLNVRRLNINNTCTDNPIELEMYIENDGNTETSPTMVTLKILDIYQEPVETLETTEIENIDAGKTATTYANLDHNLKPGSYYAHTQVFIGEETLREELLSFNIIECEDYQGGIGFLGSFMAVLAMHPWETALILFSIAQVILIIAMFLKQQRDSKKLRKIEVYTVAGASLILFICMTALAALLIDLDIKSLTNININLNEEAKEELEDNGANIEDALGVHSNSANSNNTYRVYADPDLESDIIYIAQDGETLFATKETDNWFMVTLDNGRTGWLHKSSVKTLEKM